MSSDVHAKWMNSDDPRDLGHAGDALLQPVFDRLDVVIGRALDRLDARRVVCRERLRRSRRAPLARRRKMAGTSGIAGSSASASSQAISTRTRWRISANSLKQLAQRVDLGRVAAVERRQRGQAGVFGGVHGAKQRESSTRRCTAIRAAPGIMRLRIRDVRERRTHPML